MVRKSIYTHLFKRLRQLFLQEFFILFALFCLTGGTWTFLEIADEIIEGETQSFDMRLLETIRGINSVGEVVGPSWLAEAMQDITALGGITVLTIVTAVSAFFLLLKHKYRSMFLLLCASIGGFFLVSILKFFFARERPTDSFGFVTIDSFSFPSGHAMMSAIVYLSLAAMLAQIQTDKRTGFFIVLVAFFITAMVGLSRIYLGVHFPTDVLGGWSIGIAWASIWWLISWHLQRHENMV